MHARTKLNNVKSSDDDDDDDEDEAEDEDEDEDQAILAQEQGSVALALAIHCAGRLTEWPREESDLTRRGIRRGSRLIVSLAREHRAS